MYINTFINNYSANRYLKAGFKTWCMNNNVHLKQTEKEWKEIFECDYANQRIRKPVAIKKKTEKKEVNQIDFLKTKNNKKRGKR